MKLYLDSDIVYILFVYLLILYGDMNPLVSTIIGTLAIPVGIYKIMALHESIKQKRKQLKANGRN